ncbi:MAG: hypothetical protein WBW84_00130 [Acidobacteriaceae bacterium]
MPNRKSRVVIQRILIDDKATYRIVAYAGRDYAAHRDFANLTSLLASIRSARLPIEESALVMGDAAGSRGSIVFSGEFDLHESQFRSLGLQR